MAIDPTTTTTVRVGELGSAAFNSTDLVPHEVSGVLKKGTLEDLAIFIASIIDVTGAIGFRAVQVSDGETLPATDEQEFILVGPGTYPNVGGGSAVTTTGSLNALVSNGTFWFIGVEIPIEVNGIWGDITGVLSDQTDLNDILEAKADLVGGKVPNSQLPSYVDDVIEVANYAALPGTGETGKIYVTVDTGSIYRWSGSAYIRIADESPVWGIITGTLSDQTDLQAALNAKANDNAVVHLSGTETITGIKSFTANVSFSGTSTMFDGAGGIFLKQFGLSDYNQIGALSGGFELFANSGTQFYFNIQPSTISFGLTDSKVTFDNSLLTANRTFNLPDTSGTLALSSQLHNAVTIGTANGLSLSTQVLSLGLASSSANGALSSTDWTTFNNKQNALTNPVTASTFTANYHAKFTGSGYAIGNSIVWDNGTNVGIGTASPTTYSGFINLSVGGSSRGLISIRNNANNEVGFLYNPSGNVLGLESILDNLTLTSASGKDIIFNTSGANERMRITSGGNVLVGTTSDVAGGVSVLTHLKSSNLTLGLSTDSGASMQPLRFVNGTTAVGSVTTSTTTTSYNIVSDYRLKEDFKNFDALNLISKFKMYDFGWKNSEDRMYGGIAHEIQDVVPYSVTGKKDGDDMQSVDYSKLVPILVQAIQELQEKINKLENK